MYVDVFASSRGLHAQVDVLGTRRSLEMIRVRTRGYVVHRFRLDITLVGANIEGEKIQSPL
jgi:hypothetical protein